MTTVRLSSKNQMVLPKSAREHLGVGPGDEILVIERRNGTVLLGKAKDFVRALRGSGKGIYGNVDEYIARERRSWE